MIAYSQWKGIIDYEGLIPKELDRYVSERDG